MTTLITKTNTIEVMTLNDFMPSMQCNQTRAAAYLKLNRGTLRKYLKNAEYYLLKVTRDSLGDVSQVTLINK